MKISNIKKGLYAGIVGLTILTGCAYKSPNLVSETKKDIAQVAEERVVSHENIERLLRKADGSARERDIPSMDTYLFLVRGDAREKGIDIEQRVKEIRCLGYITALETEIQKARENIEKNIFLTKFHLVWAEKYAITLRQISEKETNIREELEKK